MHRTTNPNSNGPPHAPAGLTLSERRRLRRLAWPLRTWVATPSPIRTAHFRPHQQMGMMDDATNSSPQDPDSQRRPLLCTNTLKGQRPEHKGSNASTSFIDRPRIRKAENSKTQKVADKVEKTKIPNSQKSRKQSSCRFFYCSLCTPHARTSAGLVSSPAFA